ncbi:HNH endonuclease [Bacteroides zhangwenhongii]|jgi:5-methylcytosine-specific restriction protein A|uniref:HNH endonuclease n=1 Tax=Bacteroides zhangwenhongii TaxID=2650157 RepID=UPI00205242CA|nr:HNH endonuclease [Bacteroides zhangwenhongii]DAT68396.1 MAG TPA: HNH endonuclease [Caudoviricetes sp.]
MPFLNKQPKKQRKYTNDEKRKARQKIYNSSKWKQLRIAKLQQQPLCEECERIGRITPAEHVHHVHTFMKANTEIELLALAYDYNNLMSLCAECHNRLHREMKQKKQ